jgi:ankyrin repeat protein
MKNKYQWKLPESLQDICGSLFVGYSGRPMWGAGSQCSSDTCSSKDYKHLEVSYVFPLWFLKYSVFAVYHQGMLGQPSAGLIIRPRIEWSIYTIMHAAEIGDTDRIKALLQRDPDSVNQTLAVGGDTALHKAVGLGHVDSARLLLQAGASLDVPDDSGESVGGMLARRMLVNDYPPKILRKLQEMISLAKYIEDMELNVLSQVILGLRGGDVAMLLHTNSSLVDGINDVDNMGNTALLWAVPRGDLRTIAALLKYGANPNIQDARGMTALTRSLANDESARCFDMLLRNGAEMLAKPAFNGLYPIHWACIRGRLPELKKMIAAGVELNTLSVNPDRVPGMTYAVIFEQVKIVNYLLSAGADIDLPSSEGYTPLYVAVQDNSHACLRLLLEKGADYRIHSLKGGSILHMAAACGDVTSLSILAKHGLAGLDVNMKGEDGLAPRKVFEQRGNDCEQLRAAFENLIDAVWTATTGGIIFSAGDDEEIFHDAFEHLPAVMEPICV